LKRGAAEMRGEKGGKGGRKDGAERNEGSRRGRIKMMS
jgi:hypothetical protein